MKVTRILHASVNVSGQLEENGRFYAEVLGMAPDPRPEVPGVGGLWFAAGGGQVHLVEAPMAGIGIDPTGPHFCLGVDDLEAAVAELAERGIPCVRASQTAVDGVGDGDGQVKQVWFCDPAGNTIELQQERAAGGEGGMTMERVRLGVLGAGNIAEMNVAGYLQHPDCDVLAVCDVDADVARDAAERWGVPKVYTDLDAMLADPDIDAVEVLTPTHLHHRHVLAALEAGKHVSVQKPVANTIEDAQEMGRAAREAGRTLRISECFVHYPPLELAKQLIADGAIGRPTGARIRTIVGQTDSAFQANLRPEGYGWRLDKRSPGGHLFDDMVHKYAMALWLLDQDIVSVQAVVRRRDLFFEPCACIFEYEDPGLIGTMEVQYAPEMYLRSSYYGADEFFEIQGTRGSSG